MTCCCNFVKKKLNQESYPVLQANRYEFLYKSIIICTILTRFYSTLHTITYVVKQLYNHSRPTEKLVILMEWIFYVPVGEEWASICPQFFNQYGCERKRIGFILADSPACVVQLKKKLYLKCESLVQVNIVSVELSMEIFISKIITVYFFITLYKIIAVNVTLSS